MDIEYTLDTKMEAVGCYQTQFPPAKAKALERIRAFSMQQGLADGYGAGEMLVSPTVVGTRDLMKLLFE